MHSIGCAHHDAMLLAIIYCRSCWPVLFTLVLQLDFVLQPVCTPLDRSPGAWKKGCGEHHRQHHRQHLKGNPDSVHLMEVARLSRAQSLHRPLAVGRGVAGPGHCGGSGVLGVRAHAAQRGVPLLLSGPGLASVSRRCDFCSAPAPEAERSRHAGRLGRAPILEEGRLALQDRQPLLEAGQLLLAALLPLRVALRLGEALFLKGGAERRRQTSSALTRSHPEDQLRMQRNNVCGKIRMR